MKLKFKQFLIEKPKLLSNLAEFGIKDIQHEDVISNVQINSMELCNQDAESVELKGVIVSKLSFQECRFNRLNITDCIFKECDLSNIKMSESIIRRTEFRNCKLIGCDFSESSFRNVKFIECRADYSSFTEAKLKDVAIKDTYLKEANFYNSTFNRINLLNVILRQAQFSCAKLNELDFSECDIEGVGIRPEDLAGATISSLQAIDLVKLLGVKIKE